MFMRGGVLPDHEIRSLSLRPKPLIHTFHEKRLQPASYDVRMRPVILVPRSNLTVIDMREPAHTLTDPVDISREGFLLMQGQFILAATSEWVNIPPTIVGRIEGKSSRARQGIQIHSAGYLDPGFRGNVTLEIVNFSPHPIRLWPDVLIAQLSFEWLSSMCERQYGEAGNHYQDSVGAIDSRANQSVEESWPV